MANTVDKTKYSEVKCDNHVDGFWTVDAWQSVDDNEEGKIIALINDVTGDLYKLGKINDMARGVIDEKQTEIVANYVENLAEMFNSLTDSQKDEFLRLTGNE